MSIFGISQSVPLHCPLTQEKYDGRRPNPDLTAMAFFNCNHGRERLELFDTVILSRWYQMREGTMTIGEINREFRVSPALCNARFESEKLLTREGLFNIQGLHGGKRREVQRYLSYNNDCPTCQKRVEGLYESTYLNGELRFGKTELTRWEIVQLKLEKCADFAAPLFEGLKAMTALVLETGQRRLSNISVFLHAMDFYVDKFQKQVETILILSLGFKALCLGYEKLEIKVFKKMHEKLNTQLNALLVLGSLLFVWKGVLTVVDKDLGELIFVGVLLFLIYLVGYQGLLKLIAVIFTASLINEVIRARAELNNAERRNGNE